MKIEFFMNRRFFLMEGLWEGLWGRPKLIGDFGDALNLLTS